MTSKKARIPGLLLMLRQRLPLLRKLLAVLWVLGLGAQLFAIDGAPSWTLLPLLGVVVGYVWWPQQFRLILVFSLVAVLSGLVIFAHVYFRTILMVPVILFFGLGIVGIVLSYFGRGPTAFLVGVGLSFSTSFIFPQNPIFTSPRSEVECAARVDVMDQHLSRFIAKPFITPGVTQLPKKPTWAPVDRRPYLLEIGPEGNWFGDDLPSDPATAATELRRRVDGLLAAGRTPHIFLSVDTRQPVAKVASILRDLPSVDVWVLAFKGPGPLGEVPAGAESFVSEVITADHRLEKGRILFHELSRRLGPCDSAARRMARLKGAPQHDEARLMVEEISQGLRECRCSYVDLDALEYLLKRILGVPAHEFSAREVGRDSSGKLMIPMDSRLAFGEWLDTL